MPNSNRRYRGRGSAPRERRLTLRFTDDELAIIRAAAEVGRLTVTGFCAVAAVVVARGRSEVGSDELAEVQRQLFEARVAVNRVGTNLNQAVAALNATGEAPVWLELAVARTTRAVQAIDVIASQIHRRLK